MTRGKRSAGPLAAHVCAHALLYVVALLPRAPAEAVGIALGLAAAHAAIDFAKASLGRGGPVGFVLDQLAHVVTIGVAAALAPTDPLPAATILAHLAGSPRWSLYAAGYVAIVFGGNYLVQSVTERFRAGLPAAMLARTPSIERAGKYIGWLERFLIVTFLLARHGDVIAVLIGAKAVIRYPEIKEPGSGSFADYFLIGTMTSVGLALAGGMILIYVSDRLGHL